MDAVQEQEQSLEQIRKALGATRAKTLVLAIVVFGFAWPMLQAGGPDATLAGSSPRMRWVALVKSHPDRSPLVVALRDRPEHVVWIYTQDARSLARSMQQRA